MPGHWMSSLGRRTAVGFAAIASLLAAPIGAQPVFNYRSSTYTTTFGDLTFAGASTSYAIRLDGDANASAMGTAPGQLFSTRSGNYNLFWTGDGTNIDVSNVSTNSAFETRADLTQVTADAGYMELGYQANVEEEGVGSFGSTWILHSIVGGQHALTFNGGGNGFVTAGNPFDVYLYFQGDWTDPTSYSLLGINSGWTWLGALGYNSGTDMTLFKASVRSYAGDVSAPGGNPDITMQFLGATAVPEPATFALVAGGLAIVGVVSARRRRTH